MGAGQKLWQILPLGGIGPGNSPYMSSSAFAGNLLLIDLAELQQRGWLAAADLEPDATFEDERLNFSAVVPWRMTRLERAAHQFELKASVQERADLAAFTASQRDWLLDYTLFMTLADAHAWRDWCGLARSTGPTRPRGFESRAGSIRPPRSFLDFLSVVLFPAVAAAQGLCQRARREDRGRCPHLHRLPERRSLGTPGTV